MSESMQNFILWHKKLKVLIDLKADLLDYEFLNDALLSDEITNFTEFMQDINSQISDYQSKIQKFDFSKL